MNASATEWGPGTPNGDMAPILTRSILTEQARSMPPLNAFDRCDYGACGSRALFRWFKPGAESVLDFCNHHSNGSKTALDGKGWSVIDSVEPPK